MFGSQTARAHYQRLCNSETNSLKCLDFQTFHLARMGQLLLTAFLALVGPQVVASENALSTAMTFNAFIEQDFTASATDVQGRLGAGGNLVLSSYGVASAYPAPPEEEVLVSGGDIQYTNGQIFNGSVIAAGSTSGIGTEVLGTMQPGSHVTPGGTLPFDFQAEFNSLRAYSQQLAQLSATGTAEYKWGGTYLTGDCESDPQIFNVDGIELLNSTSLVLDCIPESSTLLVNVLGDYAGLKNIGLAHMASRAERTLYNFPSALSIELVWVGIEGSVLAPYADIDNPRGFTNGTVIAKSWNGPMELHHVPFSGNFNGIDEQENQAPVYVSQPVLEALTETTYQYPVIVEDPDLDPVSISLQAFPEGMTLDEGNIIHWVPNASQLGSNPIVIAVTDGKATVLQEFSISVAYSNTPPDITPIANQFTTEGEELIVVIEAVDRETASLEVVGQNLPPFATLVGGSITFSPGFNDAGTYDGIEISVSDGVFTANEQFDLVVVNFNRAPIITSSPVVQVFENSVYQYTLEAEDPDLDAQLAYSLLGGPAGMTLDPDTHSVEWNPDASDIGTHEVQLQVTDEFGLSANQSYMLSVINSNDPPIAQAKSIEIQEDIEVVISLEAQDADGDTLSYSIGSSPLHGQLLHQGDNQFRYIPAPNFNGSDSFTYAASDGVLISNEAVVSIEVIAVNDNPSIVSQPITAVAENSPYSYALDALDVDGDTLGYVLISAPAGMTIDPVSGEILWNSANEFVQSVAVTNTRCYSLAESTAGVDESIRTDLADLRVGDLEIQPVLSGSFSLSAMVTNVGLASSDEITNVKFYSQAGSDQVLLGAYALPEVQAGESVKVEISVSASDLTGNITAIIETDENTVECNYDNNTVVVPLVVVVVSDPHQLSVSQIYLLNVDDIGDAPKIIAESELNVRDGESVNYPLVVEDPDLGDSFLFSVVNEPEGLSVNPISGQMVADYSLLESGVYNFSIVVEDIYGDSDFKDIRMVVMPDTSVDISGGLTGTDFWFAIPQHSEKNTVFISSSTPTTGELELIGTGEIIPFEIVDPAEAWEYSFDFYYAAGDSGQFDSSVHVTTAAPVNVNFLSFTEFDSDSMAVYPTVALGKEYVVASYNQNIGGGLNVLAIEDSTTIEIVPPKDYRDNGVIYEGGTSLIISLDRGEFYSMRGYYGANEYTGTKVIADKPVVVNGHHTCTYVPADFGTCDRLLSQMPAYEMWAQKYVVVPFASRMLGDVVRVMTGEQAARIQIDGVDFKDIAPYSFEEIIVESPSVISSDVPVQIAHYSTGFRYDRDLILEQNSGQFLEDIFETGVGELTSYDVSIVPGQTLNYVWIAKGTGTQNVYLDGELLSPELFVATYNDEPYEFTQLPLSDGNHTISSDLPIKVMENAEYLYFYGDPSLLIEPDASHYSNFYKFIVPKGEYPRNFINIVLPIDSLGTLELDGQKVNPDYFEPLSGSEYTIARLAVNPGHHEIAAAQAFGLTVYGYQNATSYAYVGGRKSASNIGVSTISFVDSNLVFLTGEQACVKLQLLDDLGSTIPNATASVFVSGVNNFESRITSNDEGTVRFCYQGRYPGTDTVVFETDGAQLEVDVLWELNAVNTSPEIVSRAPLYITAGDEYLYEVNARDAEADTLLFSLESELASLYIDPATGVISGVADSFGEYKVTVRVEDSAGGFDQTSYRLIVNSPVYIISEPKSYYSPGKSVRTSLMIGDLDGFADVSAVVVSSEFDLALEQAVLSNGYRIILDFDAPSVPGFYQANLRIKDGEGDILDYNYVLEVYKPNEAPAFTNTTFSISGLAGELLSLDLDAVDPEGEAIFYSLEGVNADLMSLDSATGEISFVSDPYRVDSVVSVDAVATDSSGNSTSRQVDFHVSENLAPVFSSTPSEHIRVGNVYQSLIQAIDPEGRSVTITPITLPDNASLDADTGVISWSPVSAGDEAFALAVTDGVHTSSLEWIVTAISAELNLAAILSVDERYIPLDSSGIARFSATGIGGPLAYSLSLDGSSISVDENGIASFSGNQLGEHRLEGTVTDGDQLVQVAATFYVVDAEDTEAPIANIESPVDVTEVSSSVDIVGTVQADDLDVYRVDLFSANGDFIQQIVSAATVKDSELLARLDATTLVNGIYRVVLTAVDTNGNASSDSVTVQISSDLKVGNFSFSVVDMEIEAEGIPITVTRTYDSRQRTQDMDFGYGWSLDYNNIKIEESRAAGLGWENIQQGLINFCTVSSTPPVVSVTLPNGDQEKFQVGVTPECGTGSPLLDVSFTYTPIDGTQSTLEPLDLASGRLINGNIADAGAPDVPIDPNRYRLTTKSGYQYVIDQADGIETVTTPNGQSLSYTDNGVLHSGGKSIIFERDAFGRIDNIVDPSGNRVEYRYDEDQGDLIAVRTQDVIDAEAEGIRYSYYGKFCFDVRLATTDCHLVDNITDPLSRPILKNLYDEEGRLYAQEDGDGHVKYFDHDLDANTSVVTDRDGRTTVFGYDDRGNVLTETTVITDGSYAEDIVTRYSYDENDNQETKTVGSEEYTWTSDFDTNNNMLFSENPEGNRVDYLEYNARGQETQIRDEEGRVTHLNYDTSGNLQSIEMPAVVDPDTGEEQTFSATNIIGTRGLVEGTMDLRGLTTSYTYYPAGHANAGQKWTESTAVSGTVTYTYDANNNVTTETRQRSVDGIAVDETVTYKYDTLNRLTKTIYPDESYTETVYDLAGNVDKERDRFGVWTDYTYDAYGRLRETLYPDETTEVREYTYEGLLKSVKDRSGHTTTYEYNDAALQWKVHFEDGTYTETQYTPQGWVQYQWDEKRNLTEYEYDLAGRRTAVIRHYTDTNGNPQQQRHSFTYYANGELHTETDANQHTTTYVLNALDQRIESQMENGTATQTRFDPMGARTRSIDQNLRATDYRYDDLGRLQEVQPDILINGTRVPATTYSYDQVGNKLTQTDANNHTTRWTYDYFGRVLTRTLPETMSESFVYDDVARTVTHTDFNQQVSVTYYNDLGQVVSVSYDNGESESYTYWPNGQSHLATDKNGVTEYVYDNRDRLDHEIQPDGTRLQYDYDDAGNRTLVEITREGSQVSSTTYTYDPLNRLETVTDASGTTRYTYDVVGNLDTVTYPNGIVEDYDYNSVNQLTVLSIRNAEGVVINSYTYELDDTGRRESITENDGRYTDYSYDDLYRLTGEIIDDAEAGNHTASYQYDWVGNRTYETVNGVQTQYQYDDNDRLEQQGGTVYGYDLNGNLTSETLDGVTTTYHYDERNKLTQLDTAAGSTNYSYNHRGIRTGKTEAGVTTQYIVDSNRDFAQVLLETDGTQSTYYTYGHDLVSQVRNEAESYYLYDGLGSTRALADANGVVTDTYDYEAFGELLNQTGVTENEYLFTGEQFDGGLGQYYLRARYYDQGVGRFTQMDTWTGNNHDPIALHKYLYANVDPGNMVDPTGNFSMGSVMSAVNIAGTLANVAQTSYTVFQIATGQEEAPTAREVGTSILMSLIFKGGGAVARRSFDKFKRLFKKRDRDLIETNCFDNSFVAGTLIHTKSGLVPIEDIKIGDEVLSFNELTGESEYKKVVHLIKNEKTDDYASLSFGDEGLLESTSNHPFYIGGEWVEVSELSNGLILKGVSSAPEITSIEYQYKTQKVYNFTVEGNANYYVGEEGVLVHNARPCPFFVLPQTVRSASGVAGNFSLKGYTFRIDTNRITPDERFHVHIYKGRTEIAKITANGGWLPMHGGRPLPERPSTVPSQLRTEINELIKHINRVF